MNNLFPKGITSINPKATLYKRYTETVVNSEYYDVYYYYGTGSPITITNWYVFNELTEAFVVITSTIAAKYKTGILLDGVTHYVYKGATKDILFEFNNSTKVWTKTDPNDEVTFTYIQTNKILNYQGNNYFNNFPKFSWELYGDPTGNTTEPIKGLISNETYMEIKTYSKLEFFKDDLIVIEDKLFRIEDISTRIIRLPKKFIITYLSIRSIN